MNINNPDVLKKTFKYMVLHYYSSTSIACITIHA